MAVNNYTNKRFKIKSIGTLLGRMLFLFGFIAFTLNASGQTSNPSPYCNVDDDCNISSGWFGGLFGIQIDQVEFGNNFTNSTSCPNSGDVTYFNNLSPIQVTNGETISNTVETYGGDDASIGVWVDVNQNGSFESGELLYSEDKSSTTAPTFNFDITIPCSAKGGTTRLRVIISEYGIPNKCSLARSYSDGEAQDYKINITNNDPAKPDVPSGTACAGVPFVLTDQKANPDASAYEWYKDASNVGSKPFAKTDTFGAPPPKVGEKDSFFVRAVNSAGCASTTDTVILQANPSPNTDFSVDTSVCATKSVQFNNKSTFNGSGTLSYTWDFGGGNTTTKENPTHTFPQSSGTYNVSLTAVSDFGCSIEKVVPIDVNAQPKASFNVGNNICAGQEVPVEDETDYPGFGSLDFSWEFNGNVVKGPKPTYQFKNANSSNSIKMVVTSPSGCKDSADKNNIVSNPNPNVQFSVKDTCQGDELSLSNNTSISSGNVNYTWKFGDGSFAQVKSPNHSYDTFGQYDIALKATSGKGCENSLTKQVSVHALPYPEFTATNNCNPKEVEFDSKVSFIGNNNNINYDWQFDGNNTSSKEDPVHTFSNDGQSYNISLKTTDNVTGCSNMVSKAVDVKALPEADFSFNNPCEGQAVDFQFEGGANANTYQWDFDDQSASSSEENPNYMYAKAGDYDVNLTINYFNGQCNKSVTKTVSVNPSPEAAFAFDKTGPVCEGDSIQLNNMTKFDGDQANLSYTWDITQIGTKSVENPSFTTDKIGVTNVELKASTNENCEVTVNKQKIINDVPESDFTSSVISAASRSFEATNKSHFNYRWKMEGMNQVLKGPSIEHTFDSNGTYDITLVTKNETGCKSKKTKAYEVNSTGIASEEDPENSIQAMPNPFQASTTINYQVENAGPVTIRIMNAAGKVVQESSFNNLSAGSHDYKFTPSDEVSTGNVYIFQISMDDQVHNERLIQMNN